MSKGSYTVYTPQGQNKNDTWKSCTCTLLIFLVICLIIILVVSPLKERSSPDHEKLTDASGQHSSPPEHEHHTMNDPHKQNEKIYYEIISNVPTTTKTVNPTVVTTAMPLTEKYNYVTEDSHTETTKISNIKDDSFNGKPTELTMFQTATKDIILSEPITTVSSVSSHITTDKYNNLKERETYFSTTSKIMTSLEDDHVTEISQETLPNNWSETNPVQSNQNITSGEDFQQIIEKSRLQNLQHGVTTEATPFETFSVTQENIKNGENSQKTTEINQEFFNVTNKDVYLIKEKYNEGVTEKTLSEKSLESDSESALKNNVTPTTIPEKQLTDHISTTSKINYPTTENNPEVVTKIWFYKSYQSGSKTYNSSVITSVDNTTQELVSATDHTSHYGQEFRLTTGHGSHYGQELSSTTEHSSHESSLITDRVPPYGQDIRSTTNHISNYGQELNSTTENASQYGQNLGSTTEHVSHYSQVYPQNFGDRSQNLSGTAIQSSYYKCLTGEPAKPSKVCDSNTCKNIASRSLIYMKHDGDVCKNFYNYACGGISKDYLLERDHSRDVWNRLKDSLDKPIDESSPEYMVTFQKYYASCVDYSPTVGVHPAFETLKNSPTFYEENISAKIPGLTEFLTNLLSNGFAMFFDVIVDVDINTNKLGIVILPMYYDDTIKDLSNNNWKEKDCIQSVLQSDKIYFNKTTYKCKENRLNQTVCLNNFKQALIQLTHSNMSTVIPKVISSFDKNILKIQQMYTPPLSSRNKDILLKGTTTKTLKSLQLRLPQIDWDYMLNILVSRSLPQDTKIQVYNLNYLSNILTEIKKIDKRELHNNILAFYAYKLHKKYNLDQRNVEKRQEYCLEKSALLFPDVSSSAYLDTFTEDKINELHKSAADIFERLKDTLQSDLMWLSNDDDSDRAKNKLKNLKLISLSEYMPWKNKEFLLNRLYDINMTTDFISNTYILEKRNRDQMYSLYDSDPMVPENLWIVLSLPYATKPITVTALNSIILPLGAMSLKIDNPGLPRYALMAELGYTLAKQMNLYLELSGIKILRNDIDQPKDVSFLLNDEVKGKSITLELNPSDSMTEIITDIGGAKLAYNAYEKMVDIDELPDELPLVWLNKTTKQLFFLLMAQQFCTKKTALDDLHSLYEGGELPPLFAVNSIAANSEDFIAAYGCPSDGNMTAGITVQIQHPSSPTAATPELMDNNITNFDTTDDDETGLL